MESFEDFMKRKEDRLNGVPKPKKERKGLRPVSKKQSKKLQAYAKARAKHYSEESNQRCAICGRMDNLSIHHIGKRGDRIADKEGFVSLCLQGNYLEKLHPELNKGTGGCHGTVEANKDWSRANGWLE